jgi:eukaryotic-like serine/threonine-protein kinase
LTAPARFQVESTYLRDVVGDLETECAVTSRWVSAFPHDVIARNNLGACLVKLGELDRSLGQFREAARLRPTPLSYGAWIQGCLLTDRFEEAQTTMDAALERGFDSTSLHDLQVRLAFHRKDDAAMQQQWTLATDTADGWTLLLGKANVEVYYGRLRAALRSEEEAAELAAAAGASLNPVLRPSWWQVEVGLPPAGPLTVERNQTLRERFLLPLLLARAGQLEQAGQAAAALRRDFPTHTLVQEYALPLIEGAVALASNDGAAALAALEPAARFDLASNTLFEDLYAPYLRGLAHLQAGEAALATADFQKILDHPGHVGRSLLMPLAMLQLARAQRAMGADAAALDSYEAFLELWQDADADIPIYRVAKAEHEELRTRLARL